MYRDYYKILGVRERSTKEEIKTRFRELAKQYHPDINKDEDATEKFRLILEAYQVLSDDEKRKEYDELRRQFRKGQVDPAMFREFDEYVVSIRKLIDLLVKLERYDIEGYAISLAGLIGGGLSGAWAGFKLGGVWGAVAGAIVGSVAGSSGSEKIIEEVDKRREDGGKKKLMAELKENLESLPESFAKPIEEFVILSSDKDYVYPVAEKNIVATSQYSPLHRMMYNFLSRYGDFQTGFMRKHGEIKKTFIEFARKFKKIFEENGVPLQLEMMEIYEKILRVRYMESEARRAYRKAVSNEVKKILISIVVIFGLWWIALSLMINHGQKPLIILPVSLFLSFVIYRWFIRRFRRAMEVAKQKFERRLNRIESMETKLLVELEKLKRKFSEKFGFSYDVEERSYQYEGVMARLVGRIAGDFD